MDIFLSNIVKAFIFPPGIIVVGCCLALILRHWGFLRAGRTFLVVSITALWLLSTPVVVMSLAYSLEDIPTFQPESATDAEAIVVLGGGRRVDVPEYGDTDMPDSSSFERLHYGAYLNGKLNLPIAVTGGIVIGNDGDAIGTVMAREIVETYGRNVKWIETRSRNTAQNASMLREMMPVDRILLVTHAIHMPRARSIFERVGFEVTPAPIGARRAEGMKLSIFHWLPSAGALAGSSAILHEHIGRLYYAIRY